MKVIEAEEMLDIYLTFFGVELNTSRDATRMFVQVHLSQMSLIGLPNFLSEMQI